jgi:ubiquinone/menaquinone biosynthesis C-methylase UbiE
MKAFKKNLLFKTPLLLFPLNTLFFIRRSLYDCICKLSIHINGRVLDLGCGSKPYQELFKTSEYIGVDVEVSGHKHNDSCIDYFYDGKILPFDDNTFDSIVCFEVLEHVVDIELTLQECRRVLKDQGKMLVSMPFLWGEHEKPYDFRRFTTYGLEAMFSKLGFEVLVIEKSGTGIGAIYQLFLEYFISNTRTKIIGKVIYFILLSHLSFIFYLLSRFSDRKTAGVYLNLVIVLNNNHKD